MATLLHGSGTGNAEATLSAHHRNAGLSECAAGVNGVNPLLDILGEIVNGMVLAAFAALLDELLRKRRDDDSSDRPA